MKNLIIAFTMLFMLGKNAMAQNIAAAGVNIAKLPIVYLPDNVAIHFISPEPIQYVDISIKNIVGDFPMKNLLRIKYLSDSSHKSNLTSDAVVTITGEKFIAQYHVVFAENGNPLVQTNIDILPEHTKPLDISGLKLSQREMKSYSMRLINKRTQGSLSKSDLYGIKALLNGVYTLDDYIFIDLGYLNKTNLTYDVAQVKFSIEDRKVTKASTVQSIEVKPVFSLFQPTSFQKNFRNIYVFKKFTYPGNKLLKIEMSEKQISGRVSTLMIKYSDVLGADLIPNQ